jgi:hypothetical protein
MTETGSVTERITGLDVVFGLLALVGAVLMYAGEAAIEENGQAIAAAGLALVITAGTIMIVVSHVAAHK